MIYWLQDFYLKIKDLKIFYKFFIAILGLGIVTLSTLSFWYYISIKSAIIERTFSQLQSVNILKKQQVEKLSIGSRYYFKEIVAIMNESTGMGNSGETYIVADDGFMATYSRFAPNIPPGKIKINTQASHDALDNHAGYGILKDYRGVNVFSVYSPIQINHTTYAIISEIDYDEAIKPVIKFRNNIFWVATLSLIVIILASYYLTQIVVRRIQILEQPIIELSKGIIPKHKLKSSGKDEIGLMMESVNKLILSFEKVSNVAKEIGKGNLNFYFKPLSEEDILSYSLLKMRQQLKEYSNKELELQKHKSYLLLEGEERERRRIARELHDSLGQMLTGLRFRLENINDPSLKQDLKNITDETIQELKQITNNLMPSVLADFGLEAGLRSLIENMRKYSTIEFNLVYEKSGKFKKVPFEIAAFTYRIIQEILNNALKHAQASKINIAVDKFEDKICLFIKDNGVGFDTTEDFKGMGLKNIKERIELLNGYIEINSSNLGTNISIEIPL